MQVNSLCTNFLKKAEKLLLHIVYKNAILGVSKQPLIWPFS